MHDVLFLLEVVTLPKKINPKINQISKIFPNNIGNQKVTSNTFPERKLKIYMNVSIKKKKNPRSGGISKLINTNQNFVRKFQHRKGN